MALLKPFRGVRPPKEIAPQVAAPPYDVVNREEAHQYAGSNARSFFHISRPEIDFPASVDEHDGEVYAQGAKNLQDFMARGDLKRDDAPRFYAYRQKMGEHVQVGLVACASVPEYESGLIKKHELTRADKEEDRTRHIEALWGNDEPVFLTYRANPQIDAMMQRAVQGPPEYDFQSEDGIGHTFWCIEGALNAQLADAFAKQVECLYIADGHHRSAAARTLWKRCRDKKLGEGSWDGFLAVVFPHDQMQILDYNRAVKDLNGLTSAQLLQKLSEKFEVEPTSEKRPGQLHSFGMYLEGKWYRLRAKKGTFEESPLGVLDVNILQKNVLSPLLGIADPRTDKRIHFVGGIRGMAELERLVDGGAYKIAFSMFPTTLDQLLAIADAGEIMPPKSTWFEPKLRSGLVLHLFEEPRR
jgi:uncharacterized protein (DUF1015 family)